MYTVTDYHTVTYYPKAAPNPDVNVRDQRRIGIVSPESTLCHGVSYLHKRFNGLAQLTRNIAELHVATETHGR